jgi:hypothetical protein
MSENTELIEKEKRQREAITGVVEDFVVGGQDTRRNLHTCTSSDTSQKGCDQCLGYCDIASQEQLLFLR